MRKSNRRHRLNRLTVRYRFWKINFLHLPTEHCARTLVYTSKVCFCVEIVFLIQVSTSGRLEVAHVLRDSRPRACALLAIPSNPNSLQTIPRLLRNTPPHTRHAFPCTTVRMYIVQGVPAQDTRACTY